MEHKRGTFEHSVDVLVKAYMRGELEHRSCTACAVGNLVAEAIGTKPMRYTEGGSLSRCIWENYDVPHWSFVFVTEWGFQARHPEAYKDQAKEQIDATGYCWEDLAIIEQAFERAPCGNTEDEWMFNGLMAVVDVLANIHQVDLTVKEEAKRAFVKPVLV